MSSREDQDDARHPSGDVWFGVWVVIGGLTVILVWFLTPSWNQWLFRKRQGEALFTDFVGPPLSPESATGLVHPAPGITWSQLGNVGDTYGSLNALFASLAFVIIAASLYFQRRDLTATRQAHRDTSEELARARRAAEAADSKVNTFRHLAIDRDMQVVRFEARRVGTRTFDQATGRHNPNPIQEGDWQTIASALSFDEILASGTMSGTFDLEAVNLTAGGRMISGSKRHGDFLRSVRRDAPRLYDQYNLLVTRLLHIQLSEYLLEEGGLRRVQRHLSGRLGPNEAKQIVERVREQATSQSTGQIDNPRELVDLLHDLELGAYSSAFLERCRRPLVQIEHVSNWTNFWADEENRSDMIELYRKAYHMTGGVWPVGLDDTSIDDDIKVSRWITRLGDGETCLIARSTMPRTGRSRARRTEDASIKGTILAAIFLRPLDRPGKHPVGAVLETVEQSKVSVHFTEKRKVPGYSRREFVALNRFASVSQVGRTHPRRGIGRLLLREAIDRVQNMPSIVIATDKSGGSAYHRKACLEVLDAPELAAPMHLYHSEGGWGVGQRSLDDGRSLNVIVF